MTWNEMVKAHKVKEIMKAEEFAMTLGSLDDLVRIPISRLYPRFQPHLQNGPVGYFDPCCAGKTEVGRLYNIGTGGSILSQLFFYKQLVVKLANVSHDRFPEFYGLSFEDFLTLVDANRVFPLLPGNVGCSPLFGGGDTEYMRPLYESDWPIEGATFYICRRLSLRHHLDQLMAVNASLIELAKEITSLHGQGPMNLLTIMGRSLYRGDPVMSIQYCKMYNTAMNHLTERGYNLPTANHVAIHMLDMRDSALEAELIAPGTSHLYDRDLFDWLVSEIINKSTIQRENYPQEVIPAPELLAKLQFSSRISSTRGLVTLKEQFLYEPIEAVNDIKKFLHWLDRSENIEENRRILELFSDLVATKNLAAVPRGAEDLKSVAGELAEEVKKISFKVKLATRVLEIGSTVGAAVAGKGLGSAMSSDELGNVFAMCGAVAATSFIGKEAETVAAHIVRKVSPSELPFLIWKKQSERS